MTGPVVGIAAAFITITGGVLVKEIAYGRFLKPPAPKAAA
eukprot:CAMPEP_0206250146 /NCGR_PEP_ID=MMETSP0047_2-20121206/21306_1 /ASSEMBLY_ACC=CAM_ASM_000192 /TAXON_ID=195065 /ORGANISM="Chroomonas mesostigmatica_cf, Strain CCMP1168" /LENGTH=39 /DNA_ID= /DNA_START= /DNA_END= /DNA_ORIENTATION=